MKIGEAGEAFFVFETDADVPDGFITSPLLEPTQPISPDPLQLGDISDDAVGQEPDFLDLDAPSSTGAHSSLGTSFQSTVNQSGFANTRNASPPVTMEVKEGMPQEIKASPVNTVTRDLARPVAGDHHDCSTDGDMEKADDEAHPIPSMEGFSAPHISKGGGMSCSSYWQCSCDIR
jgi:hypothetical protein